MLRVANCIYHGVRFGENERQRTTSNRIEIGGLVLKTVLTFLFFSGFYVVLPSKRRRRGNLSSSGIAVPSFFLQRRVSKLAEEVDDIHQCIEMRTLRSKYKPSLQEVNLDSLEKEQFAAD